RSSDLPIFVADVEADAVGPLEGIVFENEVVAAIGRDHAPLRDRKSVAGMCKGNALDANIRLVSFERRKDLLLGGDLDSVFGWIVVVGEPDMESHAVGFDPELAGCGLELREERRPVQGGKEVERLLR